MDDTISHPNFCIVDNFLDEDAWTQLWTEYQFMELSSVTRTTGAWKLDDGVPLGGSECVVDDRGTPTSADFREHPLLHLLGKVLARKDLQESMLTGEWDRLAARAYVYPKDTGLSWHVDDHELYAGAFVYYAHPEWNAHYGGELLIAETDGEELPIMGYRFENEEYSERLLDVGCGNFILPKPNRLVLLAGAPHMIARVSPAAGQNVRASVAGFFLRPSGEDGSEAD